MSGKPPNLLFIYTDEQAFNTLAAYGNSRIGMPNLDRLAGDSVVFDQAYVTQPVCTPSRSSLLTGLYPHTNGCTENNLPLNAAIPCLPEMLPDSEYLAAHFGKWHLGDELFAQHGFKEWIGIEDQYNRYFSPGRDKNTASDYHDFLLSKGLSPGDGQRFSRGEAARLPEELGKPAFLAREASRFIRQNKNRPFILYVNFLEPHMPFFGPRDSQYDPAAVPLPPDFNEAPPGEPLKTRLLREFFLRNGHSGLPLRSEADWRRTIANYWGLCSLVDTHAGSILNALEECALLDNTITVFTSDHGDMMGSRRLLAKTVMYEQSVRVPMLVRFPPRIGPGRVTGPVSQIDLAPTLLDLMGAPIQPSLQGKSLLPLLQSRERVARDNVFIEWNGFDADAAEETMFGKYQDWMLQAADISEIKSVFTAPVRTIITPEGWKFNYSGRGEHELFDLAGDPLETRNLFGTKNGKTTARKPAEQIRAWQSATRDTAVLPPMD